MKEKPNSSWHLISLRFLLLFFATLLYLAGLIGGMLLLDFNEKYANYFIFLYLTLTAFLYIWFNYRGRFTKERLLEVCENSKLFGKGLLKLIAYLILGAVVLTLIFLVGGLVASLSATTIIIILLVFIWLK